MSSDPARSERPLGRVAILGLGLMGGSLARAVTGLDLAERVTGWSPQATERDAAQTAGAVTFTAADWRRAVEDADLVMIATPLAAALSVVTQIGEVSRHATVTDVASLKAPMLEAARRGGIAERFVGSHPMAGSEASGFWASRGDLFQGARVWTVTGEARPEHGDAVERFWSALGAHPRRIDARDHDRLMAWVSHLPQLTANALADVLAEEGVAAGTLGPGGADMTRLAGSEPTMWKDLLTHGSPELVAGLRGVSDRLGILADLIEAGDMDGLVSLMRRTRTWRQEG